jgi:tripartite-type tricarboxylate transporter receptor subunit TctC
MRVLVAGLLALLTIAAHAQYPTRPVRVVTTFSAGSATDTVARTISERLASNFSQQFIVDNRTGAGGTIGMGIVAASTPDGYTLMVNSGAQTVVDALYAKLAFNTRKDFVGVASLASMPGLLVAAQHLNVRTVADLISAGKARQKPFAFASAGVGSSTHLLLEKFRAAAGIDATHIPYKGSPDVMVDLGAGRIDLTIQPPLPVMPFVRDKRVVVLAVSAPKRYAALPEVPTMAEAGLKDNEYQIWMGLFAPAKTPPAIIERLHQAASAALGADEVKARFAAIGMEPMPQSRAEFARMLAHEFADNLRILRAAGVKPG